MENIIVKIFSIQNKQGGVKLTLSPMAMPRGSFIFYDFRTVRARPGRLRILSALGFSHGKSGFVWRFCMGAQGA
jgi:hypothetical protein